MDIVTANKNFCENTKRLLAKNKIPQYVVARTAGVSDPILSYMLCGKRFISVPVLLAAAEVTGTTPDELLGIKGKE